MKMLTHKNLFIQLSYPIALLFILTCLIGCNNKKRSSDGQYYTSTRVEGTNNIYLEAQDFKGVILPSDSTNLNYLGLKEFTPTEEEIFKAERIFQRCLNIDKIGIDSISIDKDELRPLPKYIRQYAGMYNDAGQKIITLYCIYEPRPEETDEWKKRIIMIRDGGNSVFSISINITTEGCFHFSINSIA